MIIISIFLVAYAFYMLYSTSDRAELSLTTKSQRYFHSHRKPTKYIACTLLILTLASYVYLWGIAGALSWLTILMAMGCLIVILFPMRLFSSNQIIAFFLVMLLIELYFTYACK